MKPVETTEIYDKWLKKLKDDAARRHVLRRTDRAAEGNFGDYKGVGSGVIELRIHYGPGYRVYLTERHGEMIILLAGGTKKTQQTDIAQALYLAKMV